MLELKTMKTKGGKIRGSSYQKRVADINRIYDDHVRDGLSNREILRRFIQPVYPISESTLYNILKAENKIEEQPERHEPSLFDNIDSNQ